MIIISKFRSNDLNPSKGKQIEFNPTICKDFFGFTDSKESTEFECRSLVDSNMVQNIKVTFTLSPSRGDYKIYNNKDGSNLKDFFLDTLGLTENNINDYFAIKKKYENKYILFYIPDSKLIRELFAFTKSDNIIINNPQSLESKLALSPLQVIFYGAPGTGKSYKIKGLVKEGNHVRTTFHPDSDYASFVGAYKPTMIEISSRDMAGHIIVDKGREVKEKKIVYEFVAQAFLKAYTEAWKRSVGMMTDQQRINAPLSVDWDNKYYLVIEEINRGNCAQIFGDLFQLLDRDDNGESSYAIHPDKDIQRYLAEQFEDCEALPEAIRKGEEMKLPRNLYIFATMNTSDQSLFPIDSAFKRRWDWEYVPIKDEKKGYYIKVGDSAYSWSDFLANINEKILKATNSDDKQMGYWFVHLPEGQKEISTDKFVGKVLFYLWNDVFKDFGDGEDSIFIGEKEDGAKYDLRFKSFFGDERDERISDLMRYNKVEPIELADDADEKIAEKLEDSDDSISIDKTSTAYTKWKEKHDTYWAACQEAYASDQILKLGHRNDYPNAYDVPLTDGNGVIMRIWHLTHKGEKCMALGVRISETASLEIVDALVEAIPEWNEKFNLKFAHLSLNTGSQIRACSPQYDFNNPKDVEASIEWVKNLANNFYNTVEDILKGKE